MVLKPVGNGYWLLPEAGGFPSALLGQQVGSVQEQQSICPTFSFRVPPILHPPCSKWAPWGGCGVALQPLGSWGSAGAQVCYTKANLVSAYWVYLK